VTAERCARCNAPLRGDDYEHMGERYCCLGCAEGEGCVCADYVGDEPEPRG
jgi:hypothetical protein